METIHVQPNGYPVARKIRVLQSLPLALKYIFRDAGEPSYLQKIWERRPEHRKAMRNRPSRPMWNLDVVYVVEDGWCVTGVDMSDGETGSRGENLPIRRTQATQTRSEHPMGKRTKYARSS